MLGIILECGIVEQGGVVEGLLKITSEEGRGDVSSDTVATFCFLPLSLCSAQSPLRTTVAVTVCVCVGVSQELLTHLANFLSSSLSLSTWIGFRPIC